MCSEVAIRGGVNTSRLIGNVAVPVVRGSVLGFCGKVSAEMIICLVDIDLVNRQLGLNAVKSGFAMEQVQVVVAGNAQQGTIDF